MVIEKFCIMLECATDLNYFYGEWIIIPWNLQAIFTFLFSARNTISTAIMRKTFLYQVYTNLVYVPLMYRRVKKLRVLIIIKYIHKYLARKNGNEIIIWIWNNPGEGGGRLNGNRMFVWISKIPYVFSHNQSPPYFACSLSFHP